MKADWLTEFGLSLIPLAEDEVTAAEIATRIHRALLIAEAEKYATEKSRFIFGLSGATSEDIAEIYRNLTPFERSVVVIEAK